MKKGFTPIPHDLMEVLLSNALSNAERRILLFIARKTYGYNKQNDGISLSQFESKLGIGRKYINEGLKRLKLVSLLKLVSRGNSVKNPNKWKLDYTNYTTKLVSLSKLVSTYDTRTSFQVEAKIFHTKERKKKEIYKESVNNKEHLTPKEIDLLFSELNTLSAKERAEDRRGKK